MVVGKVFYCVKMHNRTWLLDFSRSNDLRWNG